ncbi:RES family NAD+ phosphorylase [Flavihumibacter sp. ZG627]|uniref:RES family NAD+ phosphorylase n=1 Tax=Flavihumibacter sp. ZG627 TaxID=1463156 RepID=UPI00058003A6|nr:RES family NAD+ phosphorylase [Flavihumibacter sp. ZG627]KIC92291.1 RES domain-containing protein [Flavihumibacter sp. ZG627]
MEVFRIAKEIYSSSLIASGNANRWNFKGQSVIYTSSSRSLSTLELIVHKGAVRPDDSFRVMVIHIPDDDQFIRLIPANILPDNWRSLGAYSQLQKIGSDWIKRQDTLILKVPSAVVPHEYNYLINFEHPKFRSKVKLVTTEDYFWDSRLF